MTQQHFVLVRRTEIDDILRTPPQKGKHPLSLPLFQTAASMMFVMEACETPLSDGTAEIHRTTNDLFLCLEGQIQFICGGELVEPVTRDGENELRATDIRGGEELTLNPGDWLFIRAGTPHESSCEGVCRLMVIKIPEKEV